MHGLLSLRALLVPVLVGLGLGVPFATVFAEGEDDPASDGAPLVFDRPEHDFGQVGQEQELEAEFRYRNVGSERIERIRAIGDCGCYGVSLSAEALDPGAEGVLKVRFRTLMMSGRVSKRIRILYGSEARAPIPLRLRLDVVAGVILDPGRIWFGDVLLGTSPSKTVHAKWHQGAGRPFEVTSIEVPGYDFDIRTESFAKEPWQGTSITLAFKKAPPLGMFSATALLRTDHPDYPRISLPITANVTGKVWLQSRTVYFGLVNRGHSKKTTILVRPFGDDVDLGSVTARSREGKVRIEVERHPLGREGWWRLLVEVPEDAPLGKVDDVVEVQTAVAGEEVTEIEVRGEVVVLGQ